MGKLSSRLLVSFVAVVVALGVSASALANYEARLTLEYGPAGHRASNVEIELVSEFCADATNKVLKLDDNEVTWRFVAKNDGLDCTLNDSVVYYRIDIGSSSGPVTLWVSVRVALRVVDPKIERCGAGGDVWYACSARGGFEGRIKVGRF